MLSGDDVYAPFAGAIGTVFAFMVVGFFNFDRFVLVSDHLKSACQASSYTFELGIVLLNGIASAFLLLTCRRFTPRLMESPRLVRIAVPTSVSFAGFGLWPVALSILIRHL